MSMSYDVISEQLNKLKEISRSDDIQVVFKGKDGTFRFNRVDPDFDKHVKFVHFENVYDDETSLSDEVTDIKHNGFNFLRSYEEDRKIIALFEHVGLYR